MNIDSESEPVPLYTRIYAAVRQIPPGKVASYGQIAELVGDCSARVVGYAMAATPQGSEVPWQRVINSMGKISPRGDFGSLIQRQMLEEEGVRFDSAGQIDFEVYGWLGVPRSAGRQPGKHSRHSGL
jgi:methylated-DNA-protein-cysteine methyltransferase-like protein